MDLAGKADCFDELTRPYNQSLLVPCIRRGDPVVTDGRHSDSIETLESVPCALGMFLLANGDYEKTIIGCAISADIATLSLVWAAMLPELLTAHQKCGRVGEDLYQRKSGR